MCELDEIHAEEQRRMRNLSVVRDQFDRLGQTLTDRLVNGDARAAWKRLASQEGFYLVASVLPDPHDAIRSWRLKCVELIEDTLYSSARRTAALATFRRVFNEAAARMASELATAEISGALKP